MEKHSLFSGRQGETLVSVVVGTLMLALAIAGIAAVISNNAELERDYEKNNTLFLLQNNASIVIRRIDTSMMEESEVFYLQKDLSTKTFRALTGSTNEDFRYINGVGEWTNSGTATEPIYARSFYMEKKDPNLGGGGQVIKAAIRELIRK